MKAIVKTTGQFGLMDASTRDHISCDRPYVVTWTQFLESRTGAGQLKILASGLPDAASDADFLECLKEAEDVELAVAAYVSMFAEDEFDREALEARAAELEITFRSNISDAKLAERIAEAEAAAEA